LQLACATRALPVDLAKQAGKHHQDAQPMGKGQVVSVPNDGGCREIDFPPFVWLFSLFPLFWEKRLSLQFFFYRNVFIWILFNFLANSLPKLVEHPCTPKL
jgi:hypothetical protein